MSRTADVARERLQTAEDLTSEEREWLVLAIKFDTLPLLNLPQASYHRTAARRAQAYLWTCLEEAVDSRRRNIRAYIPGEDE